MLLKSTQFPDPWAIEWPGATCLARVESNQDSKEIVPAALSHGRRAGSVLPTPHPLTTMMADFMCKLERVMSAQLSA